MNTTFHVRARLATMSMAVADPNESGQSEIQWMPPGENEINAEVNGTPGKIKVVATPATAELVDKKIKAMIAAHEAGEGVLPYLDFDHKDGEASGYPISAHWGGDDKKTGGVRMRVAWSDLGLQAIRGKRWQAFSPSFFRDKDGNVSGVDLNVGGLVNRPAFKAIQQVTAASRIVETAFNGKSIMENNLESRFLVRAKEVQAERGLENLALAYIIVARECPELYVEFRDNLGSKTPVVLAKAKDSSPSPEFVVQAKQLAGEKQVDEVEAYHILARENPTSYDQYRQSLGLSCTTLEKAKASAVQQVENHEFIVQAKQLACREGIDIGEASVRLSRENSALYNQYREALGHSQ